MRKLAALRFRKGAPKNSGTFVKFDRTSYVPVVTRAMANRWKSMVLRNRQMIRLPS